MLELIVVVLLILWLPTPAVVELMSHSDTKGQRGERGKLLLRASGTLMGALSRNSWQAFALVAMLIAAGASLAQGFPSKPMRLVVPYGPIGLPDVLARLVASKLSESMGQPVAVENKPGAGGIIAYQFAAKAAPDGHTLLLMGEATHAITPVLYAKLPYDPIRDFTPVTEAVRTEYFLVVNSSLGVGSVQELVALAKSRPGIAYGSPGSGQIHHLATEQLKLMAKIDLMHVPYKGIAQATPALLSGDVSVMFMTLVSVVSHVNAGKLRVLAVASAQRSPRLPQVPTVAESGLAGFEVTSSLGFSVASAVPRAVVERLNVEMVRALKSPGMDSKFAALGAEVVAGTPEQFAERLRRSREHYARLIPQIGLKVE